VLTDDVIEDGDASTDDRNAAAVRCCNVRDSDANLTTRNVSQHTHTRARALSLR
jgi:hypothetical protein